MAEYSFKESRFHNPTAAREYLESIRWPNGPVCPHCGTFERISKIQGKSHRPGLYQCLECREQFTVTVGTVFERSKISLDKWVFAATLMASSKKGVSSKQIERMLGVTYKTAWFMTHRLREAMKAPGGMFNTSGGTVEADATYVGGKEKNRHRSSKRTPNATGGSVGKQCVFALVERDGAVQGFHITGVNAATLKPLLTAQLNGPKTRLMTDGERILRALKPLVASHETVNHAIGEYVRGDIHTNTVEGYFSILKRGIYGTFHSVSEQHLQRYVTEFDFRYNNRQVKRKIDGVWQLVGPSDQERTVALLKRIGGKRLTYRRTDKAQDGATPTAN